MSEEGSNGAGKRITNVLQIIGNAIVGGMESYVGNLIRGLPADKFRTTCLCPYESAFTVALRRMGCEVFITPLRDDPQWRSIEMAVEIIRRKHIDLIHAHLLNAHTLAGVAGRLTNTPALATVHNLHLAAQEISVSRISGTHLVVVCQESYAQALATGIPPERVTLIPNGVDTNTFVPDLSGDGFRRAIGVSPETPLVGFLGRLSPEKGPDKFLQVAARIHQRRPDVHFAMVGEGPMEDDLADTIDRMSLGGFVHMAGLWREAWEVYPAFDVFVQTSRSEAMPLALLEAMASGCPVVAIAVGGVAELVEAGTSGILLSPGDWPGVASPWPGDWEGVASALLDLLNHPERWKLMGHAGRKRVEERFDLRTSVRVTGDLFQSLIHPASSRRGAWSSPLAALKSDTGNGKRARVSAG
jgi:glycosyltransferase involved in cell wall biosynthesis